MATPFLSSEEYDERAHELYNEGQYDEALGVLREGLALYPQAVELHIGVGYARLAREEYAWAKIAFEKALVLDGDHEDALAGYGETLLKFGQRDEGLACFRRILELGYDDDIDLILQVGRALFRDGLVDDAVVFFEAALKQTPDSAEAMALMGYARHRLDDEDAAIKLLRQALRLDDEYAEARIYLANILYDKGDYESALHHLDRTAPDDHWDELGIWRLMELKKGLRRVKDEDPVLKPWDDRLTELAGTPDETDELLADIEQRFNEEEEHERGQLELFGTLLTELSDRKLHDEDDEYGRFNANEGALVTGPDAHEVILEGEPFSGSWEDIVRKMRDANTAYHGHSLHDYMVHEARRVYKRTGQRIPTTDAETFLRASAGAGLLRIVK